MTAKRRPTKEELRYMLDRCHELDKQRRYDESDQLRDEYLARRDDSVMTNFDVYTLSGHRERVETLLYLATQHSNNIEVQLFLKAAKSQLGHIPLGDCDPQKTQQQMAADELMGGRHYVLDQERLQRIKSGNIISSDLMSDQEIVDHYNSQLESRGVMDRYGSQAIAETVEDIQRAGDGYHYVDWS